MPSKDALRPLTGADIVEIGRKLGVNIGIAGTDDPIYQTGARVRLGLPTAESLANATPKEDQPEQE
ncbi:MAG: hypothetical protein ACO1SX_20140 [Actinomycetota bacterium]